MNPTAKGTVQTAQAKPVAWVWTCPCCQARVMILSEKTGLVAHHECRHLVLYRRMSGGVEVRFADAE